MKHSYSTEENNKHKNNAFSKIISYYSTRSFSNSVKLSSTENGLLSSNTTRKHILASCSFLFYFYRLCWLFFFLFRSFYMVNFLVQLFMMHFRSLLLLLLLLLLKSIVEFFWNLMLNSCAGIWSEYGRSFGERLKFVVYSPLPWLYGIHHIV